MKEGSTKGLGWRLLTLSHEQICTQGGDRRDGSKTEFGGVYKNKEVEKGCARKEDE